LNSSAPALHLGRRICRAVVATYTNYGRVCCFKGFNTESFSFNTRAPPALINRQFELMRRLLTLGIDLYGYVTFTAPSRVGIAEDMARFVDRPQRLDENLPPRVVPLEIQVFTPVKPRLNDPAKEALKTQRIAIEVWQRELRSSSFLVTVERRRGVLRYYRRLCPLNSKGL